jgi:hypothetical protein
MAAAAPGILARAAEKLCPASEVGRPRFDSDWRRLVGTKPASEVGTPRLDSEGKFNPGALRFFGNTPEASR